jgi:hypothetical protein
LFVKLILLTCLVKFAYCYDVSGFAFFEGTMPPKTTRRGCFGIQLGFLRCFRQLMC